ncbi:hypothetical protein AYI69_g9408 [Smittium culicis]|uniref:Uncharacterized protein n=1 Tax=Smittium culicis TaxID=133412 RepID=A0A1R1XCS8_9FUNG|nr:hypothetical protein AYI69_g9408 [Smittium culicis]
MLWLKKDRRLSKLFGSKSQSPKPNKLNKTKSENISSPFRLRSLSQSSNITILHKTNMVEINPLASDSDYTDHPLFKTELSSISDQSQTIDPSTINIPSLAETFSPGLLKSNSEPNFSDHNKTNTVNSEINTSTEIPRMDDTFSADNRITYNIKSESSSISGKFSTDNSISLPQFSSKIDFISNLDTSLVGIDNIDDNNVSITDLDKNTFSSNSSLTKELPSINLKHSALGSNKLDSIVNDFKQNSSILSNPKVGAGSGLENFFSQIDLTKNKEFSNSSKRSFIETITPVKKAEFLAREKTGFIDSPMRAPPPFKKLYSDSVPDASNNNIGILTTTNTDNIIKYSELEEYNSSSIENNKNLDIEIASQAIDADTSNNRNPHFPKINPTFDKSNIKLDSKIKNLSAFDPFGPICDLKSLSSEQALASLIPLPSSPISKNKDEGEFNIYDKPKIKSNKGSTDTLLVPITPAKGFANKDEIDWESPGTFGVINDIEIEKETNAEHSRELEAQKNMYLDMINSLKDKNNLDLQELKENHEKEKNVLIEEFTLKKKELDSGIKTSLDKSQILEEEIVNLKNINQSLNEKNSQLSSESKMKISEIESKLEAEVEARVSKMREEFESKLINKIEEIKGEHKKEVFEMELKNDEAIKEMEMKQAYSVDGLEKRLKEEEDCHTKTKEEYKEYIQLSGAYMDGKDKENEGLTRELANLTLERQSLNDQVLNLNHELIETQDKLRATDTQLSELERLNISLSREKETLENDLKVAIDREQIIVNHFKDQNSLASEKISELENKLSQTESECDIYKAQVARLEFSLKRARVESSNLKEENEELNKMYSNLESMMSKGRG